MPNRAFLFSISWSKSPLHLAPSFLINHLISGSLVSGLALLTSTLQPATAAAAAKSLQSCPTLRPHRWQPTRLPHPWDSPGKNTGMGCHFLLQCMKVKSESEVGPLCLTLHNPMDCSLPASSAHGIFQARVLEWGANAFSTPASRTFQKILIVSPHHCFGDKGKVL